MYSSRRLVASSRGLCFPHLLTQWAAVITQLRRMRVPPQVWYHDPPDRYWREISLILPFLPAPLSSGPASLLPTQSHTASLEVL